MRQGKYLIVFKSDGRTFHKWFRTKEEANRYIETEAVNEVLFKAEQNDLFDYLKEVNKVELKNCH